MSSLIPGSLISRLRFELRRYGLRTTIGKAAHYVRRRVYLFETHVWYELPLATDRPRKAFLPPGLTLIQGSASDIPLLLELPTQWNEWAARQHIMKAGADLWLLLDERRAAIFACWIFHGRAPMLTAQGAWFALPPEIVFLEDSVTSPSYRGRGPIAPAVWSEIASRLEKTEAKSIITKVEEDNKVMRWALARSGFREIATMRFRRVGLQEHTVVVGTGATIDWLAGELLNRRRDHRKEAQG